MEEIVKRPRGNPNWGKKTPKINEVSDLKSKINETAGLPKHDEPLADVWLTMYAALITTYNTPGPAIIKAAATNADLALDEYKKRYNQ